MVKHIKNQTKEKLLRTSKSIARQSEENLLSSIESRRKAEFDYLKYDENMLNIYEFVLLLNFEISCLLNDMIESKSKLGPNMYGRHILLIIHESTLTLRNILAEHFKNNTEHKIRSVYVEDLKNIHSQICKLHNKAVRKFGEVRNGITAHKDEDPNIRVKLIEDSDIREVTDLILEFLPIILALQKTLYKYLQNIQ